MSREVTARRYRVHRRLARIASLLVPWQRKRAQEALLRSAFGDLVEAGGHLLLVDPEDRLIGARLRRRGIWSEAETRAYPRWVRRGARVVEVGAHVGYFSLLFARLAGPDGHVFAFEPEPRNFGLLERNIARNGYGNVTPVRAALSREPGEQRLALDRSNLGDHRLGRSIAGRDSISVPVTTLDRYLADDPRPVDFLKLDVQGSEPAAFAGARGIIEASSDLSMLTEFWPEGIVEAGDSPRAYLTAIAEAGFSIFVLEASGELVAVETEAARKRLCRDGTDVNLFCRKAAARVSR